MLNPTEGSAMKAIRLHELEGPDELVYEDVPEPEPGPGEAVVRNGVHVRCPAAPEAVVRSPAARKVPRSEAPPVVA